MTFMQRLTPILSVFCTLLTIACDDEPLATFEGPTLPYEKSAFVVPPSEAEPNNPEGHWPKEIRSVGMDHEDALVLRNSTDVINQRLGKVTLNLPLLSRITNEDCVNPNTSQSIEPKEVLGKELMKLRQEGLALDEVIVNVELLLPQRTGIYHACLTGFGAQFFHPEHRAYVLRILKELAEVEDVSTITVGIDLNSYYHLKDPDSEFSYRWDYANLMTLYQEAYDAMKEVNPKLLIGPGFSWSLLLNRTLPKIAEEFDLSLDQSNERNLALEIALQRTIWVALTTSEGEIKADFVGVSLTPNPSDAPFNGNAQQDQAQITEHYAQVALMGAPLHPLDRTPLKVLPLAFPQVDWTSPNNVGTNGKAPFIERIKVALRHIKPLFVSWLRLSDLPIQPAESSICRIFTNAPKNYPESFCFAALFDSNGVPRAVWETFTTDPQ